MRDGYVYRIDRDRGLINGLFPMFDNDGDYFTVGQRYPLDYGFYNVPTQYQPYYADNNDYLYRYGDGGIYQVNRSSGLIEGIAAFLAGDFGVGQRMPLGYDAYNVPSAIATNITTPPIIWYRYNDGYIYRVDPTTQLITAVISALDLGSKETIGWPVVNRRGHPFLSISDREYSMRNLTIRTGLAAALILVAGCDKADEPADGNVPPKRPRPRAIRRSPKGLPTMPATASSSPPPSRSGSTRRLPVPARTPCSFRATPHSTNCPPARSTRCSSRNRARN